MSAVRGRPRKSPLWDDVRAAILAVLGDRTVADLAAEAARLAPQGGAISDLAVEQTG